MNIVKISDGLGNQMFQYAFARKINIITGRKVYLDTRFINNEDLFALGQNVIFKGKLATREYGLSHFKTVLPIADDKKLFGWKYLQQTGYLQKAVYDLANRDKWIWQYKREDSNFSGEITRAGFVLPTYYQGYFFDLKYYDDIKEILQREFSPKEKIKMPQRIRDILFNRETVSIHIRRGDFLKVNRDISGSSYYEKAIHTIESKIVEPVYFIFSDDIEWVRENMNIPGEKIYISEMGFRDYEELTIMKHCKHNIIANSTFSYWAAYLNSNEDKIIICPKRWKTNTIPSTWICI